MSRAFLQFFAAILLVRSLLAAIETNGVKSAAAPAQKSEASPNAPVPTSAATLFRSWLALSPADRDKRLSGYAPKSKALILAKLAEFDALAPVERESRLQVLELMAYLRPLLEISGDERSARLRMAPQPMQPILAQRLEQWDRLGPDLQKRVLQNDRTMQLVFRLENSSAAARAEILKTLDPNQLKEVSARLQGWNSIPPERRGKMYSQRERFLALAPADQQKTLGALPEADRADMQRALQQFESLSPEQRRACVESFQKFASMTSAERNQFLASAERWREMTPQERKTWQELVQNLPPLPSPLPPMPNLNAGPQLPTPSPISQVSSNNVP